jgi:hypothetical protein
MKRGQSPSGQTESRMCFPCMRVGEDLPILSTIRYKVSSFRFRRPRSRSKIEMTSHPVFPAKTVRNPGRAPAPPETLLTRYRAHIGLSG